MLVSLSDWGPGSSSLEGEREGRREREHPFQGPLCFAVVHWLELGPALEFVTGRGKEHCELLKVSIREVAVCK